MSSWWIDAPPEHFTEKASERQADMSRSAEAKKVNGMTIGWGRAVSGGRK